MSSFFLLMRISDIDAILAAYVRVPFVDSLIMGIVCFYFLVVEMRVPELLYDCNRRPLGWFNH